MEQMWLSKPLSLYCDLCLPYYVGFFLSGKKKCFFSFTLSSVNSNVLTPMALFLILLGVVSKNEAVKNTVEAGWVLFNNKWLKVGNSSFHNS